MLIVRGEVLIGTKVLFHIPVTVVVCHVKSIIVILFIL